MDCGACWCGAEFHVNNRPCGWFRKVEPSNRKRRPVRVGGFKVTFCPVRESVSSIPPRNQSPNSEGGVAEGVDHKSNYDYTFNAARMDSHGAQREKISCCNGGARQECCIHLPVEMATLDCYGNLRRGGRVGSAVAWSWDRGIGPSVRPVRHCASPPHSTAIALMSQNSNFDCIVNTSDRVRVASVAVAVFRSHAPDGHRNSTHFAFHWAYLEACPYRNKRWQGWQRTTS